LLFTASCTFSGKQNDTQAVESAAVSIDSLFVLTGNAELDSLLQLAAVAKQNTSLTKRYHQIGYIYMDNDHEKGKEYYQKLKNLCKYIINQPEHHKKQTFNEEFDKFLRFYQHTLGK